MTTTIPKRKPLVIAGQKIRRGETRDLFLNFSESFTGISVAVPVRVIAAKRPGPTVFLTGTIHGDELNGLGIIRSLLMSNTLPLKRGTVIAVPVVNVFGLENVSRYLPDRRDLNRCFPGSPTGSLSARLADTIFREVVLKSDFGVDFHTAAIGRTNFPNIRGDLKDPKVRELAQAFGSGFIVNGRGPAGSMRGEAVRAGVPTVILEAGETWKIEPGILELGVRGALNVLKHYDMLAGEPDLPPSQWLVEKTTWIRAQRGGVLTYHVAPGEQVNKGQILATNLDVFGQELNRIHAPRKGIVMGMTTMPVVKPGDAIFHLAITPKTLVHDASAKELSPADPQLMRRIRRHLATNIQVSKAAV
ncbi:MAG: succinylglutamate desuccinylase/aspartoacylase family protein [Verrucomicrobiae bacterium]|nr:succinylglutamate desuccinylase/aspartoacylase family protein [Verrucomicrobiae bacterium]